MTKLVIKKIMKAHEIGSCIEKLEEILDPIPNKNNSIFLDGEQYTLVFEPKNNVTSGVIFVNTYFDYKNISDKGKKIIEFLEEFPIITFNVITIFAPMGFNFPEKSKDMLQDIIINKNNIYSKELISACKYSLHYFNKYIL